MAGYLLVEERMMQPAKAGGVPPHPVRYGLLDYLRELRQEVFPFPAGHRIRVVGLEDVLRAAGESASRGRELHSRDDGREGHRAGTHGGLRAGRLQIEAAPRRRLWFEVGTRRISLRPIFGRIQHIRQHDNDFFLASFNLS